MQWVQIKTNDNQVCWNLDLGASESIYIDNYGIDGNGDWRIFGPFLDCIPPETVSKSVPINEVKLYAARIVRVQLERIARQLKKF